VTKTRTKTKTKGLRLRKRKRQKEASFAMRRIRGVKTSIGRGVVMRVEILM
jgi:hypothetical protein